MEHLDWFSLSLIAAISFVVMFYSYQKLQQYYPINTYLFYVALGSLFVFGIFLLSSKFTLNIWLILIMILAGISSWLGNYAYNLAIKKQINLGYIEAVSSIRLVVVYFYSLVFLDANFELFKAVGVIGIMGGVFLIGRSNYSSLDRKRANDWIIWSLLSGVMFGGLIILSRYANDHGVPSAVVLFFVSFISILLYGAGVVQEKVSFRLSSGVVYILVAIVAGVLGNLALFTAYSKATNLAYPTAINNSRLVLLYLLSLVLERKDWQFYGLLGVLITLASVIILS